jgi:hypothetical protein
MLKTRPRRVLDHPPARAGLEHLGDVGVRREEPVLPDDERGSDPGTTVLGHREAEEDRSLVALDVARPVLPGSPEDRVLDLLEPLLQPLPLLLRLGFLHPPGDVAELAPHGLPELVEALLETGPLLGRRGLRGLPRDLVELPADRVPELLELPLQLAPRLLAARALHFLHDRPRLGQKVLGSRSLLLDATKPQDHHEDGDDQDREDDGPDDEGAPSLPTYVAAHDAEQGLLTHTLLERLRWREAHPELGTLRAEGDPVVGREGGLLVDPPPVDEGPVAGVEVANADPVSLHGDLGVVTGDEAILLRIEGHVAVRTPSDDQSRTRMARRGPGQRGRLRVLDADGQGRSLPAPGGRIHALDCRSGMT